jgi:zinc transport system substrate-binding protein
LTLPSQGRWGAGMCEWAAGRIRHKGSSSVGFSVHTGVVNIREELPVRTRVGVLLVLTALALACFFAGCTKGPERGSAKAPRVIVTSDTILSGMVASLLPAHRYSVEAILPPGQCPGHYDVKLSDIEKMKKADLIVSFRGMPHMEKAAWGGGPQLLVDAEGRNWMAPDSYLFGLGLLADGLAAHFPEDKDRIGDLKRDAAVAVKGETDGLRERIKGAGIAGKAVVASSMQREPLEWMGFRVVAEYARPEAISAKEVVRLVKIGRNRQAILVVDNLQSGPDTGKGIAETLRVPHVVLTNFPSEKGYLATLRGNVEALLAAAGK